MSERVSFDHRILPPLMLVQGLKKFYLRFTIVYLHKQQHNIFDKNRKLFFKYHLLEKIPSVGICRVTGVSGQWLQNYVNNKYGSVPRQLNVRNKKKAA